MKPQVVRVRPRSVHGERPSSDEHHQRRDPEHNCRRGLAPAHPELALDERHDRVEDERPEQCIVVTVMLMLSVRPDGAAVLDCASGMVDPPC
jgi:hypothetical protein